MDFRTITLKDKALFNQYAVPKGYYGCNLDFCTLFLWNIQDGTTVCEDAAAVYVEAKFFRHIIFCPPFMKNAGADMTDAVRKLYEYSRAKGQKFILRAVSKDMLSRIDQGFLQTFEVIEDRNNFDYIYNASDLINLTGKAFHGKRNHINQFANGYPRHEYRRYNESDRKGVIELYEEWASYQSDVRGVTAERIAMNAALDNMDALGLCGGVITVEGKICAFTIGGISYNGMGIVHFEKGDINYKGIYPAINNFFAADAFKGVMYINRQEDMGIENLRKSKLSYNPAFMAEKFIITEKQ